MILTGNKLQHIFVFGVRVVIYYVSYLKDDSLPNVSLNPIIEQAKLVRFRRDL